MAKDTALMRGYIRAIADSNHPLQTKLSLILTDFEPNGNKQGVPISEKDNIINSALHMPIKINFDGYSVAGHIGAVPIGPITNAYISSDNGRDVIAGEAVIWNDVYGDVAEHLKTAFAEGIGTSWEIYYETSEIDDNDVQWLHGCIFGGTCVVHTPAYGPTRTRVLAIAEELNTKQRLIMDNHITASDTSDVVALQDDLSSAMTVLSNIYDGLWQMLDETYQIEQQLATTDMPSMSEQFSKLITGIAQRFKDLKEKAGLAEAEAEKLKGQIQQIEHEKEEAELLSTRRSKLVEAGLSITDDQIKARRTFYLDMSNADFDQYIVDLSAVRSKNSAQASLIIPEPTHDTQPISVKDLAAEIRKSN